PLLERAIALEDPEDAPEPSSVRLAKLAQVLDDLGRPTGAGPLLSRALVLGDATEDAPPDVTLELPDAAMVLHELEQAMGSSLDLARAIAGDDEGWGRLSGVLAALQRARGAEGVTASP